MNKTVFLFSFLVLGFMFCKKEGSGEASLTDTLLRGPWIESEHWTDFDKNGVFELALNPTCLNDDSWTFLDTKIIEHRDLGEVCDTSLIPVFYTGKWRLENDNQVLYIEYDPDFAFNYFKVAAFNDSMIELWYFDPGQPSDPVTEKIILRKQ
jgi:hypothetical protein